MSGHESSRGCMEVLLSIVFPLVHFNTQSAAFGCLKHDKLKSQTMFDDEFSGGLSPGGLHIVTIQRALDFY